MKQDLILRRACTGVPGLHDVLHGGLVAHGLFADSVVVTRLCEHEGRVETSPR